MKVLCVGSLNLDYTYQVDHFVRPGETLAARARSVHCGGKGLNQSIAAAKAGLQVWHAGLVGTGGAPLLDALQRYGVDTGLIRALDQPCGHTVIQVTEAGENCILLYGGTNTCLTESFVDETLCRFAPGDVLLLQNEVNGIPYLIRQAVRRGLRVAFNAAPIAPEVADYPLELLSWLVINEGEGAALAGTQAPADILDRLAQRCPDTQLLLTLGAGGSVCRAGGETWSCGVFRCVRWTPPQRGTPFWATIWARCSPALPYRKPSGSPPPPAPCASSAGARPTPFPCWRRSAPPWPRAAWGKWGKELLYEKRQAAPQRAFP